MMSTKKLIKIARKWKRMAALGRRRLSLIPTSTNTDAASSFLAAKGHFVIYTADKKRFMVPLEYLYNDLIQELFKMSADEFGFSSGAPITVPCDSASMEYIMSLIQRGLAKDLEEAVLAASANVSRQVISCVH